MNCNCENPYKLLNPYIQELLMIHDVYYWNDKRYYVTQSVREHLKVNFYRGMFDHEFDTKQIDDVETCYIKDGDKIIPLIFLVGCGKCEICQHYKGKEWQTRCACESLYSTTPPVFVTLTYNDFFLPEDGVNKPDVQNFFKRLRKYFQLHDMQHNLRYFCVSEYGDEFGRPHYHLLLWNLPKVDDMLQLFHCIEDAWSYETDFETFKTLRPVERLKRKEWKYNRSTRNWNYVDVYRHRIGIAECELARDGSGAYCALYMGSDNNPKKYKNSTFRLSSRGKGGLGYQWCDDNRELYSTCFGLTSVELPDGMSTKHYRIPRYFIDRWFPTRSKIFSKDIMDVWKLWNIQRTIVYHCKNRLNITDDSFKSFLCYDSDLLEKFSVLPDYCSTKHWLLRFNKVKYDSYDEINLTNALNLYSSLSDMLLDYYVDEFRLKCHMLRAQRTDYIVSHADSIEPVNLNIVKNEIKNRQLVRRINSNL